MELSEFCEFCEYIYKKDQEEKLKAEWNAMLPFMILNQIKYESFKAYKERRTGANIDMRPTEVIIREIEELHSKKKGGE